MEAFSSSPTLRGDCRRPGSGWTSRFACPLRALIVCVAYFGAAKLGLELAFANGSVSAVWAPTGIALAAVLVWGWRMAVPIALGAFLANVTTDAPLVSVLGITIGNALEALVGAWLIGRVRGFSPDLGRVKDVLAVVLLGGVLSTLVSAAIGVGSLWLGGVLTPDQLLSTLRVWWFGDMCGDFLIAPLLLVAASRPRLVRSGPRILEAVALLVVVVGGGVLIFTGAEPLTALLFALIVVAALRFGQPGAVLSSLLVSLVAVWFTSRGIGPFIGGSPDSELLRAQTFSAVAAMTGLFVAAMLSERTRAESDLISAEDAMERVLTSETRLAEAQRTAHIGSWEWDMVADRIEWSDELYRIYGLDRDSFEASYQAYVALLHPDDREMVEDAIGVAMKTCETFAFRHRLVRPDGGVRTLQSRGAVLTDDSGAPIRMTGTAQDVTELQEFEHAATDAEARFTTAFAHTAVGMALVGLDMRYIRVNRALCEILGFAERDLLGTSWRELTHPDDLGTNDADIARVLAGEHATYHSEKRYLRADGDIVWAMVHASVVRDESGEPLYWVVQVQDITGRRKQEEALRLQSEITATMAEGVCLTRARDGVIVYANRSFEAIFGYDEGELVGKPAEVVNAPGERTPEQVAADVFAVLDSQGSWSGEIENIRKDGSCFWTQANVSTFEHAEHGLVYVSVQSDITARKRSESKLQHLADHDPLTGLFNRRRFAEELERQVEHAKRYKRACALLTLDLDNFKYANDTLGHNAGDEVLVSVARELERALRSTDIIGRPGGDEFSVILPEIDGQQAVLVAAKLTRLLRKEVLVLGGKRLRNSTSIGVSCFDGRRQITAEELMLEADAAMYEAKEAGRDRWSLYQVGIEPRRAARVDAANMIRDALENDRFVIYAQPILNLATSEIDRYELLLRMRGAGGELIPPGAFLGTAERVGLIQAVDRYVAGEAITLVAEHARAGKSVSFNVNLSARSLEDPTLPDVIERELAAAGAAASLLTFEVTETAAITNVVQARRLGARLRELGCGFALDDFGAGFASFYYLKELPFDTLKIDGAFVRDLPRDRKDQLVVKAVVDVAKGLGKTTVAEFVENEETLELLRKEGVDYAQGFHIARPGPVEELMVAPPQSAPIAAASLL